MRSPLWLAAGGGVLGMMLATIPAQGATAILAPTQDTTIFSNNDGAGNGAGPNLFVGNTLRSSGVRRSLLSFDASSIPAGAQITSVVLTMRVDQSSDQSPFALSLHRLLSSWGEGTAVSAGGGGAVAGALDATWTKRFFASGSDWLQAGGEYVAQASATAMVGAPKGYEWSSAGLVADVQLWAESPSTNYGWIVIGDEIAFGSAKRFVSSEGSSIADRPSLLVSFMSPVPEPRFVTLLICGVGLIGFVLRSHQRRLNARRISF